MRWRWPCIVFGLAATVTAQAVLLWCALTPPTEVAAMLPALWRLVIGE